MSTKDSHYNALLVANSEQAILYSFMDDYRKHVRRPETYPQATPHFANTVAFCRDSCSDNDSGICADSSSEQSCPSPKCSVNNFPAVIVERSRTTSNIPTLIPSLKLRKGCRSRSQTRGKPMKVRFADEIVNRINPDEKLASTKNIPDQSGATLTKSPPSYDFALNRLALVNGRKSTTPGDPVGLYEDDMSDSNNYANLLRAKSSNLVRSMENLAAAPMSSSSGVKLKLFNSKIVGACRTGIPSYSADYGVNNNNSTQIEKTDRLLTGDNSNSSQHGDGNGVVETHQNCHNSKNSIKPRFAYSMTQALQTLASNGVLSSPANVSKLPTLGNSQTSSANKTVKARLLSIDSKGVHVVHLQKFSDGPFGFYISTGTYKNKKGIFISRINVPTLDSLLSVGDQIVEIDNAPTKGQSLEHAQSLMCNKNQVVLKITPVCL